jgi:site-specific recombinase XerD
LDGHRAFFRGVRQGAKGASLGTEQVERIVRRAGEAAGIQERDPVTGRHKVTPHSLRHTYATRLLRDGFGLAEVQVLLGHARAPTTSVYMHADPVRLREKVQGKRQLEAAKVAEALLAKLPEEVREALAETLREV